MSRKRQEMVYAGALHHDGALVHAYFFVKGDGSLSGKAQLYPNPLGDYPPGARVSFLVDGSGESVMSEGAMFKGMWDDSDQVDEWTVRHEAVALSEEAWSLANLPKPFERLAPMRDAYLAIGEEQRGVLIGQIVRYLTTPPDDKETT